ncbi:MAG: YbjN domain-containing protein [bacterium]|nr:YbjN domain-containing protein [bacterium]
MAVKFEDVKNYLYTMGCQIEFESPEEEILVVTDESKGIKDLIIDCESPIIILEQVIFDIKTESTAMFKTLLKWNREIIHGAFVINDSGDKLIFRDTLQLENLDFNELEGSINALGLALAEYSDQIILFAR